MVRFSTPGCLPQNWQAYNNLTRVLLGVNRLEEALAPAQRAVTVAPQHAPAHFILGDVYRRFPFPPKPEDFKQMPEGDRTRAELRSLIEPYGEPGEIRRFDLIEVDREAMGEHQSIAIF